VDRDLDGTWYRGAFNGEGTVSYTLIKGSYRVVGFQPDGDSVRFVPEDAALVNSLPNRKMRRS
jgi:hypothetical protein